jgi:hypothetical protein
LDSVLAPFLPIDIQIERNVAFCGVLFCDKLGIGLGYRLVHDNYELMQECSMKEKTRAAKSAITQRASLVARNESALTVLGNPMRVDFADFERELGELNLREFPVYRGVGGRCDGFEGEWQDRGRAGLAGTGPLPEHGAVVPPV